MFQSIDGCRTSLDSFGGWSRLFLGRHQYGLDAFLTILGFGAPRELVDGPGGRRFLRYFFFVLVVIILFVFQGQLQGCFNQFGSPIVH